VGSWADGWTGRVLAAVVAGGVLAGFSGLVIAGTMKADVETLKRVSVNDSEEQSQLTNDVASLKANVANLSKRVDQQRQETREDLKDLDRKLDRILERLPTPQ